MTGNEPNSCPTISALPVNMNPAAMAKRAITSTNIGRPRRNKGHAHAIIDFLRETRIRKQIRLDDLAKRTGYNRFTMGDWEAGVRYPTLLALADWVAALGLEIVVRPEKITLAKSQQLTARR